MARGKTKGNRSLRSAFAVLLTLSAGSLSAATGVTIGWAAGAQGNQSANGPAINAIRPPDGKGTYVSSTTWLVAATFKQQVTYSNLAAKLGLTGDEELKRYDIIAFDGNSRKAPFENSIWFVTNNAAAASGMFLGEPPPKGLRPQQLKFRAGWMPIADYRDVFGKNIEIRDAENRPIENLGWILVDIPDTVKIDEYLKIFLTGVRQGTMGSPFNGSPGPDAIGLIIH